jgi:hypothetical protein
MSLQENKAMNKVINNARDSRNKGRYLMDYSKVYADPYDVVEKARKHIIAQKSQEKHTSRQQDKSTHEMEDDYVRNRIKRTSGDDSDRGVHG